MENIVEDVEMFPKYSELHRNIKTTVQKKKERKKKKHIYSPWLERNSKCFTVSVDIQTRNSQYLPESLWSESFKNLINYSVYHKYCFSGN